MFRCLLEVPEVILWRLSKSRTLSAFKWFLPGLFWAQKGLTQVSLITLQGVVKLQSHALGCYSPQGPVCCHHSCIKPEGASICFQFKQAGYSQEDYKLFFRNCRLQRFTKTSLILWLLRINSKISLKQTHNLSLLFTLTNSKKLNIRHFS